MMKISPVKTCRTYIAVVAAFLFCISGASAVQTPTHRQQFDTTASQNDFDAISIPARKVSSFWHSPAKDSPSEQYAYANSLEQKGRWKKARKAYNSLVHKWHDSPEAPQAQLGVARLFEKAGKRLKAFAEYQYAIENFSGTLVYSDIIERQFLIANELRGEVDRGFMGFGREAGRSRVVKLYENIAESAPNWTRADECYYLAGLTLEEDRGYVKAIVKYETLVSKYPESKFAGEAMLQSGLCRARLADRNPNDERTLRNAISALSTAVHGYPQIADNAVAAKKLAELSARLSSMNYQRAVFYDRIRGNEAAAVVAYEEFLRMFPSAPESGIASERLTDLKKTVALNELMRYKKEQRNKSGNAEGENNKDTSGDISGDTDED